MYQFIPHYNVAQWLDRWATKRGQKTAVLDSDLNISVTYKDLAHRSLLLAKGLLALNIKKGDVVSVLLENSVEFLEVFFACTRIGALFTPFSFRWSTSDLITTIKHCRPKCLITSRALIDPHLDMLETECKDLLSNTLFIDHTPSYSSLLATGEREELLLPEIGPEDPQVLMYTAGTTSRPKGCVLPYRKALYNVLNAQLCFGLNEEDRALCALPLFHSGGLFIQAVPTLCSGGTLILMKRVRGDPHRILVNLERHQATSFVGVAFHARLLAEAEGVEETYKLGSMRYWSFGGEVIPTWVVAKLQAKWPHIAVSSCYGTSETSLAVALSPTHRDAYSFKFSKETGRFPAGRVMFYCDVKLVDDNGKEVGVGEVGEVLIKGPITFLGYWLDKERTREVFDNDGWFHTGDLAMLDDEGYVYIVDRKSNVIKSGGEKILATKVEEVLRSHPNVAEAAVIGVPNDKWGERPYAFVVPRPGATLTVEELFKFCEQHLSKIERPDYIKIINELPKTGPSKVSRWRLRELALESMRSS